ncbi:MAG: DUF429 domain-containing protein [Alphaproteobacteria bacterium]|nr:DUF429 domain-containing protein [Alphaproteobacteria bacterium]
MKAVGVDGCHGGWIAVWIGKSGIHGFAIFPRIAFVLALHADLAMIDIPIGLPETGDRGCDLAARKMLGKDGQSRVFLGARRPLLQYLPDHQTSYDAAYIDANKWAKSQPGGKGLSRQLFGILPKIAEADEIMTPARQETLREAHPELVFQDLSHAPKPLPSKTSPEGQRLRRDIADHGGFPDIDDWIAKLRGTRAKPDDLLDACACCIAALRASVKGVRTVECPREVDAKGLRMEICY